MRLDKLLANAGIGSRSEVKRLIKLGLIGVNQTVVFDAGFDVDPQRDEVKVDGDPLAPSCTGAHIEGLVAKA
ncbi:MAG: S4 domain-containing protein, partial [Bacilli bacterium]